MLNHRYFRGYATVALLVWIMLTGCTDQAGPSTGSSTSSEFSMPVPDAIRQSRIDPSELTLVVEANGEILPTSRIENGWIASITVPLGQSVQLSATWSRDSLILATLEKFVESVTSNLAITYSSQDYEYRDNDEDGFTNLEEIDASPPTDPNDATSFPSAMPEPEGPILDDVSPRSLTLSAEVTESDRGEFSFTNSGDMPLEFSVLSNASWLMTNPEDGLVAEGEEQTVEVSGVCGTIEETRQGTLTIESNGGDDQVVTVSIRCTVAEPPPVAILDTVDPDALDLSAQLSESADGEIRLSNIGTAVLSYTVESSANWLSVSPSRGSIPRGQSETVDVTASCGTTAVVRSGTLTIMSNGGDDQTVSVSIECSAAPVGVIGDVNPRSLDLTAQILGNASGTISFRNVGTGSLSFSVFGAGASSEWLTITPFSGEIGVNQSQTLEVIAQCDSLIDTRTAELVIRNDVTGVSESVSIFLSCTPASFSIGDIGPGGGIVFHVTDGGTSGLEAAPNDAMEAFWGCEDIDVAGITWIDLDMPDPQSGAINTPLIVEACGTDTAAGVAASYSLGAFTDWFLPNKEEWILLHGQRIVVGGFTSEAYWTSSLYDDFHAWIQNFDLDGFQQILGKGDVPLGVRPIRAFLLYILRWHLN